MSASRGRNPIYTRQLRGVVTVRSLADRCTGEVVFRVSHVSAGGDIAFTSAPILVEDQADAAARVLAEFVDAREVKLAP